MLKHARTSAILASGLLFLAFASGLRAQEITVDLDPAATKVEFTLAATMHTVHGTFKLKSGQIRINTSSGKASGAIVLDATSGDTDNSSRDKKMHGEILESAKFPEITFTPNEAKGDLTGILTGHSPTQVEVAGVFRLHGQDHDATLKISAQPGAAGRIDASSQFSVPYIQWGLKSPNTFLLHVADSVDVTVHASGKISASP
jgi:polyisoprenoid-binding protein YceI